MPDDLQFDAAEPLPGTAPSGAVCIQCHTPITDQYYEAGGQVVCPSCKQKIEMAIVPRWETSSFARACVFGCFGAAAGAAVYYGVRAATGYEIGLIAIVVGFLVGYAVRKGSHGRGGRGYQALALTLTYLAIGTTYLPLILKEISGPRLGSTADSSQVDDTTAAANVAATADSARTRGAAASLGIAVILLVVLAIVMPVLVGFANLPSSLISLLITGFALQQAWRMNAATRITFTGPFRFGAPAFPGTGGGT